jgi:hypothetical protein
MRRIKGAKPSPALLVAVVALVAALAGTAIGGVAVTSLSKKDKKQVKKISKKQAKKLDKKIESTPGPKGDQGPKGDPGQDATNLFAYVRDNGGASAAVLDYGEGATGVSDPAGENNFGSPYVVTFNRDLSGCVAHSTTGFGEPDSPPSSTGRSFSIGPMAANVEGSAVETFSFRVNDPQAAQDTSFMVSVFC